MHIRPLMRRQPADSTVKAAFRIRRFDVYLNTTIILHLGMSDLCIIIQGHKRIHHTDTPIIPCSPSRRRKQQTQMSYTEYMRD